MIWSLVLRLLLAAIMLVAAVAKLANRSAAADAFEAYGVRTTAARHLALGATIAIELWVAVGLVAGWKLAAAAGLAMTVGGAAMTATLLARGRAGRPCPCFGARTRIGRGALARDVALTGALAAILVAPTYEPTRDQWFAVGLGAALVLCLGLAVAVAALAREIGMLRMRIGPSAALEIPGEGPPLGAASALAGRFGETGADVLLAVFLSRACRVCEALRPAVASIRGTDRVQIEIFDEGEEDLAWQQAEIPGSPYAVAMDAEGIVRAKGTFNNLAQLEGLVGAARSRTPSALSINPGPAPREATGV